MLNRQGRILPNLVVAERVIERMAHAAQSHIADETGEAMVGLVTAGTYTNGVPSIYVLDTIAPDDSAVRGMFTFQQGDTRQDELIWWLQENWQAGREKRGWIGRVLPLSAAKWDAPLRYIGDWHKQPGFMIQPSGGDLQTALDWIDDPENEADYLIAPIVTLGHPATVQTRSATSNYIAVPLGDGEAMRVDFWYIEQRARFFQPINLTVYPDDQLPALAPYPWHLSDDKRFDAEMERLKADGWFSSLCFWNADNEPPLEICFLLAQVGADHMLIAITHHDYPQRPPEIRLAPYVQMGANGTIYTVFEQAYRQSKPVAVPLGWSADMTLADALNAIEGTAKPPARNEEKMEPPRRQERQEENVKKTETVGAQSASPSDQTIIKSLPDEAK
jgi:hypothetical protein